MNLGDLIKLQDAMILCLKHLRAQWSESPSEVTEVSALTIPDIERLKAELQWHYESIFRLEAKIFLKKAEKMSDLIRKLIEYEGAEALKPLVSWWALWSIDLAKADKREALRDLLVLAPSMLDSLWPAYRTEDLLVKDVEQVEVVVKKVRESVLAKDDPACIEWGWLTAMYARLAGELPRRCLGSAPVLKEFMELARETMKDSVFKEIREVNDFKTLLDKVLRPESAAAPPQQAGSMVMLEAFSLGDSGGSGAGSHAP